MGTTRGYLIVALGTALTFGSVLGMYSVLDSMTFVLLWGVSAVVGVLLVGLGTQQVWTAAEEPEFPNPDRALRITDSRFGRQ